MNIKYLIGGIIIVSFFVLAIFAFDSEKIEYQNLKEAQQTGQIVQVNCQWLKDKETYFDQNNNQFIFYIKDENGFESKVVLDGMRPANFDTAPKLVIKGQYKNNEFHATEVLTKCPSKYEGKGEHLGGDVN